MIYQSHIGTRAFEATTSPPGAFLPDLLECLVRPDGAGLDFEDCSIASNGVKNSRYCSYKKPGHELDRESGKYYNKDPAGYSDYR